MYSTGPQISTTDILSEDEKQSQLFISAAAEARRGQTSSKVVNCTIEQEKEIEYYDSHFVSTRQQFSPSARRNVTHLFSLP